MWGETLFSIEEDDYGDYTENVEGEEGEIEIVQGSEIKFKRFKSWYDNWIQKINGAKKLMPEFKVSRVRKFIDIELAKVEDNISFYDNLDEGNIKNKEFYKICNIFLTLNTKLHEIEEKMKYEIFSLLLVYGEVPESKEGTYQQGDYEIMISKVLPVLRKIFDFIEVITLLVLNTTIQLNALYHKNSPYYKLFKNINFFYPLRIIGRGLKLLLTLDTIINENIFYDKSSIKEHWERFKDSFSLMKIDPEKFGVEKKNLRLLERVIVKVDRGVIKGESLRQFLKIISDPKKIAFFEEIRKFKDIKGNKYLGELFKKFFKHTLEILGARLGSKVETREAQLVPELCCLFAFYTKAFQTESKDTWKAIWSLQKKMLVMYLHEHVCYEIGDFMMTYCAPKKMYSSLDPKKIDKFQQEVLASSQSNFIRDVAMIYKNILSWIVQITSLSTTLHVFNSAKQLESNFKVRINLIKRGLILSTSLKNLIRGNILLRYKLGYSIDEGSRPGLLMLINLSKKMEETINGREIQLMQDMMIKYMGLNLARRLGEYLKRLKSAKISAGKDFINSVYQLNYRTMLHYPTHQRRMIFQLCSDFLKMKNILKDNEYMNFMDLLWEYDLIINFKEYYKESLSCSFSYWIRDMMADFLEMMSKADGEYFRLQIFLNSLEDSKDLLNNSIHLDSPTALIDAYRDLAIKYMNDSFMKKLSNKISDDLLVQSHHFYMVYQLEKPDPYNIDDGDMNILMKLRNVVVLDRIVNIKELTELSISEKLYNRAIFNKKNYHIYEVMRSLAKMKYGLDVGHSYVPAKTIEQGRTDILSIIRNFVQFTQKFRYNMFNQSFIETLGGDGSRLLAISISHISDSIKTHGLGVINTCVDIVHKFVLMRINNFSQMMLDETLKSYLVREHRWLEKKKYKDKEKGVDQKYPLLRGQKFKKELSLASTREKGFNIIEKFRLLITTLGNALAFARILRTASFNHLSQSIEYIPYIEEHSCSFGDTAHVLNYGTVSKDCCKALDKLIAMMRENFSKDTDFLRVLVQKYKGKLSGENFDHVEYFYHLVPPLTLNYIQSLLIAKEKLLKKNFKGGYISDDGFILGLSFLTEILEQKEELKSVHWFSEVQKRLRVEVKELEEKTKKIEEENKKNQEEFKDDESIELGLYLRQKKGFLEEFDLLENGFKASNILFRDTEAKEENFFLGTNDD